MIPQTNRQPPLSRRAAKALGSHIRVETGLFNFGRMKGTGIWVPTFAEWLPQVSPALRWDWPHLQLYREYLDAVTRGEIRRLIVFMPPQHGKSTLGTIHYPVYRLVRDPTLRVIVGAYGQDLANDFGRQARRVAREAGLALSDERTAVADWQTARGGRYLAVGAGAGVTGKPADLILIDDPIKSRQQAESQTEREKVWDWLLNDLLSRGPQASIILTLTHWHWDDPAGRFLTGPSAAEWTVLSLPAEAEENDPLGRQPGEMLCPDRLSREDFDHIKLERGEYIVASLYQQRPTPRTGNMFPRDAVGEPVLAAPAGTRWCRGWDKAGTQDGGKRTAGVKLGIGPDKLIYIAHVITGQWEAGPRERVILQTAQADGRDVAIELEQEPGSGGKDSALASVRMLQGFAVRAQPATGDKVVRAEPFAAQWQAGNVRLLHGDWNLRYLDEMSLAPHGKYLDQMDASTMAYNRLTLHAMHFGTFRVAHA